MESCKSCSKPAPEVALKQCSACHSVKYCSRDCQKADWKSHKPSCRAASGTSTGANASHAAGASSPIDASTKISPPQGLERGVTKPFTRLDSYKWLHDRSEKDVYRLLIDSYRLFVEDRYNIDGKTEPDSLRAGKADGLVGFKRYLDRVQAARKGALLPSWWDAERRAACESLGMEKNQWSSLRRPGTKADMIERYGDSMFPAQLRMFTESVTGTPIGGIPGMQMRKGMMIMEGEGSQPKNDVYMSVFSLDA